MWTIWLIDFYPRLYSNYELRDRTIWPQKHKSKIGYVRVVYTFLTRSPPNGWASQNAAPLKFDPKPSEAAFSPVFFRTPINANWNVLRCFKSNSVKYRTGPCLKQNFPDIGIFSYVRIPMLGGFCFRRISAILSAINKINKIWRNDYVSNRNYEYQ